MARPIHPVSTASPLWRALLLSLVLLGLSGCGSVPFTVTAARFDESDAPPATRQFHVIAPQAVPALGERGAARLAEYTRSALVARGWREAPPDGAASMMVEAVFVQEPPRKELRAIEVPITQWQPERTVLTTKKTKMPSGIVITERVPTKLPAQTVVVGTRTFTEEVEIFPSHLRLIARESELAPGGRTTRTLWSVEVRHEEKIEDLDAFLTLMVAAAMDYLGTDDVEGKAVRVSSRDRRARALQSTLGS